MEPENLIGKEFNSLRVIAFSHKDQYGSLMWLCRCQCGRETVVRSTALKRGDIKSCGCQSKSRKHGLNKHKLYNVWQGIKTRCSNPKSNRYKYYGGKGVKICEEWLDFSVFFNWAISHGYREGLTLDRKNRDANYEPENCQWVSYQQQNLHKSDQKRIIYQNAEYTVKEVAKLTKIPESTLYHRLRRGINPVSD